MAQSTCYGGETDFASSPMSVPRWIQRYTQSRRFAQLPLHFYTLLSFLSSYLPFPSSFHLSFPFLPNSLLFPPVLVIPGLLQPVLLNLGLLLLVLLIPRLLQPVLLSLGLLPPVLPFPSTSSFLPIPLLSPPVLPP